MSHPVPREILSNFCFLWVNFREIGVCCCSSLVFVIFDACYKAVVIVDGNKGCCVIVPHRANFIEVITP